MNGLAMFCAVNSRSFTSTRFNNFTLCLFAGAAGTSKRMLGSAAGEVTAAEELPPAVTDAAVVVVDGLKLEGIVDSVEVLELAAIAADATETESSRRGSLKP